MFQTPEEVLTFIKDEEIVFVDVRFTDMPGVDTAWWTALTVSAASKPASSS